jgi:hypothetical protein
MNTDRILVAEGLRPGPDTLRFFEIQPSLVTKSLS